MKQSVTVKNQQDETEWVATGDDIQLMEGRVLLAFSTNGANRGYCLQPGDSFKITTVDQSNLVVG